MKPIQPVRVRFAPSPTGYLHVGGARTAIYNYFYAKATGGKFLLRIEDTDRKRYNEEALHDLLRDLRWLGLQWDEGPEVEGDCGPYQQSQRLPLYGKAARTLVETGHAYHCFCNDERPESQRITQEQDKNSLGYDRHCRDLPAQEIQERLANGQKFVIRFRTPLEGLTTFVDQLRGIIQYQNQLLDDLVLLKRDGFPTYHLASVVDDHHMHISHVLRGDEWIASTPKHQLLYQAFGWTPPIFCHLPVILAAGGGKLSKRKGAASVGDFREAGFLPQTMVNYLALLGWSPGDDREVMSVTEMAQAFTLDRIGTHAVSFDEKKLQWMNAQHIARLPESQLTEFIRVGLEEAGLELSATDSRRLPLVAELLRHRLRSLNDIATMSAYFFSDPTNYDEKARAKNWCAPAKSVCMTILENLPPAQQFTSQNLELSFNRVAEELHLSLGNLVHPVRLAVSGVSGGPGLFDLLATLGRDTVERRLRKAIPLMDD